MLERQGQDYSPSKMKFAAAGAKLRAWGAKAKGPRNFEKPFDAQKKIRTDSLTRLAAWPRSAARPDRVDPMLGGRAALPNRD